MAAKTKKAKKSQKSTGAVVAKSEDGSIQITFTVPWKKIESARKKAAEELGKNIQVPGFRKGKAPYKKLYEHIPENTLLEKTLSSILPKLVEDTIEENSLKPAIYPKFELIKAKDDEDWEIRALTCELPEVKLGDYKKALKDKTATSKIWTPGKGAPKDEKENEPTREEKEQLVIQTLLETTDINIPQMLIDEEANSRLSQLLEKIEKLGLNLESYLQSVGKTAQTLRKEYEEQAKNALSLDLILTKVAEKEKIKTDKKEVDKAIGAASADRKLAKDLDTPQRRRYLEVILTRRKALNQLSSAL